MFQVSQKDVEAYLYKSKGVITDPEFLAAMINYFIALYIKQQSK